MCDVNDGISYLNRNKLKALDFAIAIPKGNDDVVDEKASYPV